VSRGERRFNLVDGLILVAAAALTFRALRTELPGFGVSPLGWRGVLDHTVIVSSAGALFGTLALLILRLRRPRPPLRRLTLQPGFTAGLAIMVHAAFVGLSFIKLARIELRGAAGLEWVTYEFLLELTLSYGNGSAVAAVWLVAALGGRWRAERSWLDRSGRVLGVFWIVSTLVVLGLRAIPT
jgi:hypothetical protein